MVMQPSYEPYWHKPNWFDRHENEMRVAAGILCLILFNPLSFIIYVGLGLSLWDKTIEPERELGWHNANLGTL